MGGRCLCALEFGVLSAVGSGCARNEDWLLGWGGAGSCQHDVFPWIGIYCGWLCWLQGCSLCLNSPWSPATAAPRLMESTRQCDTHVSPTPSCSAKARETGEQLRRLRAVSTAQGCLTSTLGLVPSQAQPWISVHLARCAPELRQTWHKQQSDCTFLLISGLG